MNGTERGFGAGSTAKSGTTRLQAKRGVKEGGADAGARARIALAFDNLLNAAMARLRLHYAARIAGLMLGARGGQHAAVTALLSERDAALEELGREIQETRRKALRAARRPRRRRYRAAFERLQIEGRGRPTRPGGRRNPARTGLKNDHSP